MAFRTGNVIGHYELVDEIRSFVATQGWVEMEASMASADRLLWWKAPGLSGLEEIFMGLRTYQSVAADIYNIAVFGAIGHVPGNGYTTQPGFSGAKGVPLWNQPITYWMTCNAQRLFGIAKIQNVYEPFYIGKFTVYGPPSQYPYPLFIGGMLDTESMTRYSETTHFTWAKGNSSHSVFRFVDGGWRTAQVWPWAFVNLRNTNQNPNVAEGSYGLYPIVLNDAAPNIYGELDGAFFISGYNNATENVANYLGDNYFVARDVHRTGFGDYIAMRMD